METEQGKQVLVAKCAFSEQRNDSYVLASVVTGTLPRAEQGETTYCCCSYSGLYEWSAFPSGGRGLLVPGNEREQGESMKLLNTVCIRLYLCQWLNTQHNDLTLWWLLKDSLIKWIFKNPSSEIPETKTRWWSCILAALCVGRRRNVAGLCYGWMFLLYIVNRRECWSFPVVLVCVEFWFNSLPSTVGTPTVLVLATFRIMDHMGRHI